jgi:hypothetical protein
MGPAEAWCKRDGVPEVFPTRVEAEAQAARYNQTAPSLNVRYSVREMEPELAQSAMRERAFVESREVYLHPAAHAREMDELPLYRTSNRLNREYARSIAYAVNEHWDGMRMNPEGVRGIVEQHGERRVGIALANTVCQMAHDTRFSQENRDWAASLPKLERADECAVCSHPVKLDSFIQAARRGAMRRGVRRDAEYRPPARRMSTAARLETAKQAVGPPVPKAAGQRQNREKGKE